MNRRFRAFSLALVFFMSLVVPVKQSHAVPLVPIALALVQAGGAVLASDALASAGTAIIGGIAVAAILLIPGDNPVEIRLPLTSSQSATDAAMPSPSAASTVDSTMATVYYANNTGGISSTFGSPGALVAKRIADLQANPGQCGSGASWAILEVVYANPTGYQIRSQCRFSNGSLGAVGFETGQVFSQSTRMCPAGYTDTGSSCNLSSARLAVADSKVDYARSSSGYSALSDADSGKATGNRRMVGNSVQVWGNDSNGNPVVVTAGVDGSGNSTIDVQKQVASAGGQSTVKKDSYVINGATGAVQSVSSAATAGSISYDGATSVPTVSTGAAVTPTEAAQSESIVFPTDYARAGEAASAANTVKTSVDKLSDISDASLNDPVEPDASEFTNSFFKDSFNPLSAWSVPGHVSECPKPDLSYTAFGYHNTLILDAHCTVFESVKGLWSLAFDVMWVVVALFIVLGA